MSGINSVVLVGRLTRDVEVRKTTSGVSYARFTVAVDRRFQSRDAQQSGQQTADFISCSAWRQRADFLGSYGKKGTMVGIEGSIQTGSYTGKDGNKVYTTDVAVDNVQLLSPKGSVQSERNEDSYGSYGSMPSVEPADPYASNDSFGSDDFNTGPTLDISSDDLPF